MHFTTQLSKILFLSDDSSCRRLDDEQCIDSAIEDIVYSILGEPKEITLYLPGEEFVEFVEQDVVVDHFGKFIAQSANDGAYEITAWMHRPVTQGDIVSRAHLLVCAASAPEEVLVPAPTLT